MLVGSSGDEVVANAAVLLFGGIETTDGMITNAVLHLLAHRDQLALVRADPRLLDNAIEESLRLEPAAAIVDRYATARRPARRGRDQRARARDGLGRGGQPRPGRLRRPRSLRRRPANARAHLAFAHGPHVCLGMHLARLEARTALRRLLERLPRLRLDPVHPAAPRGLVFRKPPALHVLWS